MSRETENNKPRRTREDRKKLFVRIMALLLAILMVGGMAYYTIYLLATTISADSEITETIPVDTSSLSADEDVLVRVGLTYGSNITVGFETTTTNGYIVGITDARTDNFIPIWELNNTKVAVTTDANLSKSNMTYTVADSAANAVVGGFHIQVDCDKYDREEYEAMYADAHSTFASAGVPVIPAYVYTGYTLRIGTFTTWGQAEEYLETVKSVYPNEVVYVTGASKTSVSVIDPNTDAILFEYDCGDESNLGLKAQEDIYGNTYIKTPAANVYDGVFTYIRAQNGSVDGVSLINIVPLEAYIAGVLPYELNNTWPLETLKAFAVTVRSYTMTHLTRHSANSFGLCNNAHCQVYKGAGRINGNIMDAVLGTAGQVMTYNNEIVTAYYSSSMGGVTVSAKDAWGGTKDIPYLQAMETPWEDYTNHDNGFWITEISPENLASRLNQAGYTEIRKAVASVDIVKLAKNSTYIYQLKVKDVYGNSVLIESSEDVRTSLTPYVKSANFVIGKGSVEYTENVVSDNLGGSSSSKDESRNDYYESGEYDKDYGYINLFDYHVLTYQDEYVSDIEDSITVLTGSGDTTEYERRDIFVISSANAAAFTGEVPEYSESEEEEEETHVTETIPGKSNDEVKYKIAYADDPDNFIIVGKGWGHGVGISQYGAYDLALMGYSAEDILTAYFKGIKIVHYTRAR
ncbi:MAG: SpoIID/LytB domain-containing protein [Ruminococcaceae bacterium]|nr:SpoIID/LytB domain-containing protein [Oscillospiraceae bacterium]